jgi:hypothetical protein
MSSSSIAPSKVLIVVRGGVAHYAASGNVDIVLVDHDNIDAGDPPSLLSSDWRSLARELCLLDQPKYLQFSR